MPGPNTHVHSGNSLPSLPEEHNTGSGTENTTPPGARSPPPRRRTSRAAHLGLASLSLNDPNHNHTSYNTYGGSYRLSSKSPRFNMPAAHDARARTPRPRNKSFGMRNPAELALDFIIVGAGNGLATGFALAQAGHRVQIFDRNDGIHQRSTGVRVPPNLSKILAEWGLQDELLSKATKCRKSVFLSLETNERVGVLEWQEDVIKETGGDFFLMHYDDLYSMLYNLAASKGVKITFNTTITSVQFDASKQRPFVTLGSGSVVYADMVIGADGLKSIVREVVTGEQDAPNDSGMCYVSFVVPAEKLKADPDWGKWVGVSEWPIWMGTGRNVLGYPIRNGQEYCIHAFHPDSLIKISPVERTSESWTDIIPTDAILHEDSHPSIHRIFSSVPDAIRVKYNPREAIDDWVDESGTIMLIGEAAHPLMPCTIHNLALAVEDAAVLGVLLSHLHSRRQLPQLLEAFQDLRFSRIQQAHQSELNNAGFTTLPPGEHRDARDAGLRQSLLAPSAEGTEWNDDRLREQWEGISFAFGYDALEAAEDWWLKWGALVGGGQTEAVEVAIEKIQLT
ncbi:hypothetical protein CC1G_12057 [Coprinopsis cinerea okayama7|uniref:FAD-binding domain-containing protein n=1 Tax=Coprinopsis cinerea (strain Okayama-7 / 130 / ATCC MYA-4618 / FGSC 9003) TaxID=240176 RepID=A8N9L9_COPC7|nr:hypothetical protein CC1G_12057 [Coprinopsis cinerea okayama7\|eukprot:XP_001831525.2 hypothetical protein CC1G_12057 [Coprinopsis cinerea okayama7\